MNMHDQRTTSRQTSQTPASTVRCQAIKPTKDQNVEFFRFPYVQIAAEVECMYSPLLTPCQLPNTGASHVILNIMWRAEDRSLRQAVCSTKVRNAVSVIRGKREEVVRRCSKQRSVVAIGSVWEVPLTHRPSIDEYDTSRTRLCQNRFKDTGCLVIDLRTCLHSVRKPRSFDFWVPSGRRV